MRVTSSLVALVAVAASCGCATLRHGPTQQLSITTEPAGARCDVTRGGEPVGSIEPTPGAVTFPRGATRIEYACTLPGYLEERDVVEILDQGDLQKYANAVRDREADRVRQGEWGAMSGTQKAAKVAGVTAVVIGGLALYGVFPLAGPFISMAFGHYAYPADAAIVADPATGVVYGVSLPPVRLVPDQFPDEGARDAFLGERRRHVEAMGTLAHDVVDVLYCQPVALDFRCKPPRERVEATFRQRLEALDRQRGQTRIAVP